MTICPRCRLLQAPGTSCISCGSPLDGDLLFRKEKIERTIKEKVRLSEDDVKTSRVSGIALAGIIGAAVAIPLGFKVAAIAVALSMTLLVGIVPSLRHAIGRVLTWTASAILFAFVVSQAPKISPSFGPKASAFTIIFLVVVFFASLMVGVPSRRTLIISSKIFVLKSTSIPSPAGGPQSIRGRLQAENPEATLESWALVDEKNRLLVRHGPQGGTWSLETAEGPIALEGPLRLDTLPLVNTSHASERPGTLSRQEIAARLGQDVEAALPPLPKVMRLRLRTLRPGDEVRASGELVAEATSQGYREASVTTRRLVGSPGQPVSLS